jgi:hypothetical protein
MDASIRSPCAREEHQEAGPDLCPWSGTVVPFGSACTCRVNKPCMACYARLEMVRGGLPAGHDGRTMTGHSCTSAVLSAPQPETPAASECRAGRAG